MIPLRDNIPSRSVPYTNYAIIAICTVVFLMQLQDPQAGPSLVERFGMIPARVQDSQAEIELTVALERVLTPQGVAFREVKRPAAMSAVPPLLTMLTCVFLHGGWLHFLGNVWVLSIFGDNVEDRFGHLGYALFYLASGGLASAAHYLSDPGSVVPTIGASGAIAGVMGAYFIWYPRAQVQVLIPLFFIIQIIVLPAPVFLGIWFLIQFFQGTISTVSTHAGGVAWWAHIGGFVAGVIVAKLIGRTPWVRPPNRYAQTRPVRYSPFAHH